MTINLSREDHSKIVEILTVVPNLFMENGRQATLLAAFAGYPNAMRMLSNIYFGGNVTVFTVQLVNHLTNYGQIQKDVEALGVLLDYIADPTKGLLGEENFDRIFLKKIVIGYQMLPGIASAEQLAALQSKANAETGNNSGDENGAAGDDCYIFISYARPNVEVAKTLATALDAANYRYFHDTKDIQPGDMWSQKIEAGLRKAGRMVLLLSKASMPYRKEVEREWFYFDMKNKPIYTLLVEDCDINSRLIQVNYVDARTNVDAAVAQIVDTLNQKCKP
jgi:hypothetical protein